MSKLTAPQSLRKREAFFLKHAKEYPPAYVHAELLKIATTRAEKNLNWDRPDLRHETRAERMEETKAQFDIIQPNWFERMKNKLFKRG